MTFGLETEEIDEVIAEAQRFIKKAEKFKEKIGSNSLWEIPVESGAVNRASMDLTRALSAWRRRNRSKY